MSRHACVAALCVALLAASGHAEQVLTLNGEEAFDKAVAENSFLVAEFYAPWCGAGLPPNLRCGRA